MTNRSVFFCLSLKDQVEHAHDNPLDEITLGEGDVTTSLGSDETPSEKPGTPKRMNLEVDREPEVILDGENEAPVEGKKTKKKDTKKEKVKRKIGVINYCRLSGLERSFTSKYAEVKLQDTY